MTSPKVDTSRKALIVAVVGSSGSGKSAWTKQQPEVRKAKRLVVWDIDDEYSDISGIKEIKTIAALAKALRTSKTGRFRFTGGQSYFDDFCKIVFAWGECTAVVEELADVTSPGKAPDGWGTLVRRGRKRGIILFAVTQRPAESDKTIMGNASIIHCGRMQKATDQKYMAGEMNIPIDLLKGLKPLEYLERKNTGEAYRGKVTFRGPKVHKEITKELEAA